MNQQQQPNYNCFQKDFLLLEGGSQIYRSVSLKQPVTLQTMIPLQTTPLPQESTKYFQYLSGLNKQKYESRDIWKGLIFLNSKDLLKCLLYYVISNSSFLLYSIVCIQLFQMMYGDKQAFDLKNIYSLAVLLSAVWFYQGVFYGMGLKLLRTITNNSKRVLFYSIYVRLISHQFSTLRGDIKGRLLNTLTEFHDILEDCSSFIMEITSSSVSIVGIFVILFCELGWLGVIFIILCFFLIAIQYFYSDYNSRHLKAVAKLKDTRMSTLTEILSFLKYIKMQRWEGLFTRRLLKIRAEQYNSTIKYGSGSGVQQIFQSCQFQLTIILTLAITYNFTSVQVNCRLISAIVILMSMLQKSINNMSLTIKSYFQISILFERIAEFFNLDCPQNEIQIEAKSNNTQKQGNFVISLKDVSYSYQQNSPILESVSFNVSHGQFAIIIGQIGSGKTTLLDCISSQLTKSKGSLTVSKQFVYLEQQPPIFSGILRNNIILNNPFKQQDYNRVVDLCCLNEDFQLLENGDLTYIQEKLTNLSGGQKARIALARALYSKSKVLLLDDPLSSLDVKVGQKIFNNLMRLCKREGYTILMTLHQINFITKENKIYVLQNSKLKELGIQQITSLHFCQHQQSNQSKNLNQGSLDPTLDFEEKVDDNLSQIKSVDLNDHDLEIRCNQQQDQLKGKAQCFQNLFKYIFNCKANYFFFLMTILTYILTNFLYISMLQLLGRYDDLKLHSVYFQSFNSFIVIISLMTCVYFLNIWLRVFMMNICIQNSNKQLFKDMTYSLMKGSLAYYRGVSSGEVLDKYSVDLGALDSALVYYIQQFFNASFYTLLNFIYLIIFNPLLAPFVALLIITVYFIHQYCSPAVVAQRQESLKHKGAPILTHFQETMKGLKTIKTYNLYESMKQKMTTLLQNSNKSCLSYHKTLCSYYIYSKHISNIITVILFFLLVKLSEGNIKKMFYPTMALFDISWRFYFNFASTLNISSVLVSKERISSFICKISNFKESINLRLDENITQQQSQKHDESAQKIIQIQGLTLRYNQKLSPALKNINVSIKNGAKVAIVGRTGSGKSSFVQALYRLVQPDASSTYLLNGENAMAKSLEELRGCFSCIPQQPFVFNDTLRKNLDPFDLFSDRQIESVLSKLNLWDIVKQSQKGLESSVEQKEISFSLGETQLICLARVLLENKQIVVMDEAGSNLDERTDSVIKSVVKEQLKGKTLINIAHKLMTILDYDTILVFDRGEILERGTAIELIGRRGVFYEMLEENPQIAERSYKMLGIESQSRFKRS